MERDRTAADLGVGLGPALPTLRLVEWIRAIVPGVSEGVRQATLERAAEMLGLETLWTFAAVEDDLFLRDCAGSVPASEESAAVLDLLGRRRFGARRGTGGVRGETLVPRGRRELIVVFRDDGRGLVTAGRLGQRSGLRSRHLEMLGALAEALRSADLADCPGGGANDHAPRQARLRARLDRAASRAIQEALDQSSGDRDQAAALLGVEVDLLTREVDRLGLP